MKVSRRREKLAIDPVLRLCQTSRDLARKTPRAKRIFAGEESSARDRLQLAGHYQRIHGAPRHA